MGDNYKNTLLSNFEALQKDLKDAKINNEEFKFLVGFLLKTEINGFIKTEVKSLLPEEKQQKEMTFISYARNRRLNHA